MLKSWIGIFAALAALAGCESIAPAGSGPVPHIQGTPGKAVIYVVRTLPDVSDLTATLTLDGHVIGSTHAGTYMRLEVAPGRHRITGYAQDSGSIALDVQADRVYFVQHAVIGGGRSVNPLSSFRIIDEAQARGAMAGAIRAG